MKGFGDLPVFIVLKKCFNVYLRERERRQRQLERGRGKKTETESGAGSRLVAVSYQHRAGCRTRTHKQWDHDLSRSRMLNQLSHPQVP